ncbi:MAG: type I-C CRISPR-associated protein Cas8c/Csd1, partial [Kiritimatiellae bacterium]|nr:type I-C CRISPR-associated protein Cas8c/Csd1 [Kiritimatiellia bacterium]
NNFPAHLSLEEQGMFAIGYYHQRIAKKVDAASSVSTETV